MKRFFLALGALVLFPQQAAAATADFGDFSLDVPEGWASSQSGDMAIVSALDNSAVIVFSSDVLPEGQSLNDFAATFSRSRGGTEPEGKVRKGLGQTLQFEYKNDVGAATHVFVAQGDPKLRNVFLVLIVGENHLDVPVILNSVRLAGQK